MHAYQFLYGYPKQYPSIQDAEGKSLMANPGDVVEFETPPNDGCWFPVDPPADNPPETPAAGPEQAPEAPAADPEPEPAQPDPEPAPAPVAPAEPAPVQPRPFVFPGFTIPAVRV